MALFNYECDEVKRIIEEVSPNYPQLTTYEKEWLYFHKYGYLPGRPVELEYETVLVNPSASVFNAIPFYYKSAILKGDTKYRDIDTGDILDTFDETKNLELVSVQMPVLTTSNEDGTKTNILSINEEVVLRGIGEAKDELNLMTGELTQRIDEFVLDGGQDEDWTIWNNYEGREDLIGFFLENTIDYDNSLGDDMRISCESFPTSNSQLLLPLDYAGIATRQKGDGINRIYFAFKRTTIGSLNELKTYLQNNPITILYKTKKESVKTVDLTPLNKPYEGTNHYELTSNIPCEAILEVPVVSTGKQTLEEINN